LRKILSLPLAFCILQFHDLHLFSNEKPTCIILLFSQLEDGVRSNCGYEKGICTHLLWQAPIVFVVGWLLFQIFGFSGRFIVSIKPTNEGIPLT
jgi:hypothetical protein